MELFGTTLGEFAWDSPEHCTFCGHDTTYLLIDPLAKASTKTTSLAPDLNIIQPLCVFHYMSFKNRTVE